MSAQSIDNFKPVFKYYKRRQPPPNLNDAVDFHKVMPRERLELLKSSKENNLQNSSSEKIQKLGLNPTTQWKCFKLLELSSNGDRCSTGLIILSNAFTEEGHLLWSLKCLKDYAKNPPNKTNIENLISTYENTSKDLQLDQDFLEHSNSPNKKARSYVIKEQTSVQCTNSHQREKSFNISSQHNLLDTGYNWWASVYNKWRSDKLSTKLEDSSKSRPSKLENIEAKVNELRWATLGYHHNWDTKKYSEGSVSPFPNDLRDLCKIIINFIGDLDQNEIKAEFISGYKPEAAIVNFYPTYSSLGGHTDHSEPNRKAPLLSFSFGLSAVFLCGGPTKKTKPTSMILRSGDVLIMTETAREKFHGVPRIIDEKLGQSLSVNTFSGDTLDNSANDTQKINEEIEFTKMYLKKHRININVRQVF